MKKKKASIMDSFYKTKKEKKSFIIYMVLRILVIISAIREMYMGNYTNAALCILSLVLFTFPSIIEDTLNIEFPSLYESIIYLFIFSAEILGEINNFYEIFPYFDTILHTINGFLCAGLGFSMIDVLNKRSKKFSLSPLYLAIAAFCFSMTIGVMWEFFEYGADKLLMTDMQKDEIVYKFSSVTLDETKTNKPIKVNNIKETNIIKNNGDVVTIEGYLDIGLNDTIKDLFVNFIGAFIFSIFGFLYVYNRDEKSFIKHFIPRRRKKRRFLRRKKKEESLTTT
jgi:hypothetical protein